MTESPVSPGEANAPLLLAVAASSATGPISNYESPSAWRSQLQAAATEIAKSALSPRGAIAQIADDAETMRFVTVTLTDVQRDEKSNRGVVTYRADKPSQYSKDGSEQVRTDRLENPDAQRLASELFEMGKNGVKVRLTIVNRDRASSENGKGFRTVVAAETVQS